MSLAKPILLVSALLLLSIAASGSIIKYETPKVLNVLITEHEGVYSRNFTPAGDQDPFISAKFVVKAEKISKKLSIDLIIFPKSKYELVGEETKTEDGRPARRYCSQSGDDCGGAAPCARIIPDPLIKRVHKEMTPETTEIDIALTVNITLTDIWYVDLIKCISEGDDNTTVTGEIIFKNPYGYLPGKAFSLMPFNGWLALFYLILGIAYLVLCALHWRELLQVQYGVAGIIALGMIDSMTWYFVFVSFNNEGMLTPAAMFFAITFTVLKKTLTRALFLLVAMGLGVVKSTIGATKYKVLLLIVACFGVDLAQEILEVNHNFVPGFTITQGSLLFVNLPSAITYTAFLWWLYVSLQRTRQQLILRRQTLKSELYRTFFNVLVAVAVVAGLAAIYQIFLNFTRSQDENVQWYSRWIWDAFWEFLFFLVLCIVAFLWRPRKNNTRYGMSEAGADDEDDTILQLSSLTGVEVKDKVDSKPSDVDQYENERERNIQQTSGSNIDAKKLANLAPFSLDDDEMAMETETMVRKMD